MAELQERIDSFMERFSASEEQASFVIKTVDSWGRDAAEQNIATVIMQNRKFYKLGDTYMARRPEFTTKAAINKAYKAALDEMTADILDEIYNVKPKDDVAPKGP
jgi:hypothetical protein